MTERNEVCCSRRCILKLSVGTSVLTAHLCDLSFAREQGYAAFWFWVRTIVLSSLAARKLNNPKTKRVYNYLLPSISFAICRRMFCILLGITLNTLSSHVSSINHAYPSNHKLKGKPSNNTTSSEDVDSVVDVILAIAEEHGLPNPRFSFFFDEPDKEIEVLPLVMLPPCFSQRTLYRTYCSHYSDVTSCLCRTTFVKVYNDHVKFV